MGEKWPIKFSDFHVIQGFFNLTQSCVRGQTALLTFPPKEGMLNIFFSEKSDGFSLV
jgi:hypothetical protein